MSDKNTNDEFGKYDFGLNDEQETRAAKLHEESIIIDMLYWGPCTYRSYTPEMEEELKMLWETHRDPVMTTIASANQPIHRALSGEFPQFKECWDVSGVTAGNRWVEFSSMNTFATTFSINIAQFDQFSWQIKAFRADDFRRAKAEGKHAGYINTQLGTGISMDFIDLVEPAYLLGLRMIQLTYNFMTYVGSGCTERTDAGVSSYGARLIDKMNDLGIIVDTGHCGRQTTLDACALSKAPVVASHTSAEEIYKHARAKSDEELRAIAATGGIMGVYCMPFCLAPGEGVTVEAMLDHIDYIVNLVGWEHVALGTDWPMPFPKSMLYVMGHVFAAYGFRPEDKMDVTTNLIGFDDYRDFPNITRGLVGRGYNDEQIKGILGENFLRVFEAVCG